MSDSPSPHDAAILVLRERANAIELEIADHQHQIDLKKERLAEAQECIALLSRKGKTRRPRVVTDSGPLCQSPLRDAVDQSPLRDEVWRVDTGAQRVPPEVISTQYPVKSVFASPPAPDGEAA